MKIINNDQYVSTPTLDQLLDDLCVVFKESKEEITGHCRKRKLYNVRCIFCYVAYFYTTFSIRLIADAVGYEDHTSAIHQRDLAVDLLDTNNVFFMERFNLYKQQSVYFNEMKVIRYPQNFKSRQKWQLTHG